MKQILNQRYKFGFFLDKLLTHFSLNVVETQWGQLVKRVQSCEDFEEARRLHDAYLITLLNQCKVTQSSVMAALQHICQLVSKFCQFCQRITEDGIRDEPGVNSVKDRRLRDGRWTITEEVL